MRFIVLIVAVFLIAGCCVAAADDLETTYTSLKEAEAKKDVEQVKKLAAETSALARQVLATPAPENEADKEAWKTRIDHARTIDVYTEYALYVTAIQAPAATTIDLLSALEQQNPKSKYLDDAYGAYFTALRQTGAAAKIPGVAQRALASLPDNEDLLLVLADQALTSKQSANAMRYAERLVAVMSKHPKPEAMSAAAWERKRTAALGRGYWIAGVVHSEKNQYPDANRELRAALPLIQDNQAMLAAALFHLGLVNYQLGKLTLTKSQVLEAAKFSEQAGAIPGPLASQARHNALVMRNDAIKMR